MMMALATFGIGVLPPGAVLGVWAPVLLICLKLVQGFSTGGEYAGATTFITEYAPDKKRGFYAALLDWGSYMGNALGAGLVTVLMIVLPKDVMSQWGWRIPFLVALPMGGIALYLRTRIEDTPAFRGEPWDPKVGSDPLSAEVAAQQDAERVVAAVGGPAVGGRDGGPGAAAQAI